MDEASISKSDMDSWFFRPEATGDGDVVAIVGWDARVEH